MDNKNKLTSIIIPVKDESEGIDHLFNRLMPILEQLPTKYELVFINDGSNDNTLDLLLEKQKVFRKSQLLIYHVTSVKKRHYLLVLLTAKVMQPFLLMLTYKIHLSLS